MIAVKNLVKNFGPIAAVRGASFSLERGSVGGLLGVNGAGKSTTIRILAGSLVPSHGSVIVAGIDMLQDPIEAKRHLGYMPEYMPLYEDMSVEAFLRYLGRLRGLSGKGLRTAVDRVIDRCALGETAKRLTGGLSRGFRQRVGIAQALVHEPEVLILDEPTSGLDPVQVTEFRELIRQLADQHTVLLSTHILGEVAQVCDQVIIMGEGKILLQKSLEELEGQQTLEELFVQGVGTAA